jgi:hypothetical protein
MSRLIPLADIPYAARATERAARRTYLTRAGALGAAAHRIVVAPGCHGRPHFDPPVVGWVCTRAAADALEARTTRMPDGTTHRRLRAELDAGGAS